MLCILCGKTSRLLNNGSAVHFKVPISLAWRLVGDLLATRVSVGRGDVAATSPGDLAGRGEIKQVRFFLRLFGDFFKSPVGFRDVAATSRLNMFSRRKTSLRRLRDVSQTCSRPNDWGKVATTSPNVAATRRRRLRDDDWPTFIDLERKLSKKLKLVYTCKTWYMMYIDKICTRKFFNIV